MWSPADPLALPSQEERRHANKAIVEVESQLTAAIEALANVQSIVDDLTKELFSRRAWQASIRKISPEIFILAAEVAAYAPVKISEVSCWWREK